MILISKAIRSLYPDTEFIIEDEDINKITWIKNKPSDFNFADDNQKQNALNKLIAETSRLDSLEKQLEYRQKRKFEYPSIGDQLDALWKGGEAAAEMLAKVQAVKTKYPKGA